MTAERSAAIVLTGPPGVGKTTTGRAFARELGAALLDLDTLTNPLVEVVAGLIGAPGDYADPELARLVREPRYAALVDTAVDCLSAGVSVVLVAPFTAERTDPAAWERLAARLRAAGGDPVLVWLRADADLVATRMRRRAEPRDVAKLAALRDGGGAVDLAEPRSPHLVVDAARPVAAQVRAVIRSCGPLRER